MSCQSRALGEEEEEEGAPEPPKASEPQGGRRPGTPQQAVSAGLSRLRQRRQKAPSGGYQETLGLKRGSWGIWVFQFLTQPAPGSLAFIPS